MRITSPIITGGSEPPCSFSAGTQCAGATLRDDAIHIPVKNAELVQVRCLDARTGECLASNLHMQNILNQTRLEEARAKRSKLLKWRTTRVVDKESHNMLMLFLDNFSSEAFTSTMPKTVAWLSERMKEVREERPSSRTSAPVEVFQFLRYNVVGDRSYPNISPMFRGHSLDELARSDPPFIWDEFHDAGYVTLWSLEECLDYMHSYYNKSSTTLDHEVCL